MGGADYPSMCHVVTLARGVSNVAFPGMYSAAQNSHDGAPLPNWHAQRWHGFDSSWNLRPASLTMCAWSSFRIGILLFAPRRYPQRIPALVGASGAMHVHNRSSSHESCLLKLRHSAQVPRWVQLHSAPTAFGRVQRCSPVRYRPSFLPLILRLQCLCCACGLIGAHVLGRVVNSIGGQPMGDIFWVRVLRDLANLGGRTRSSTLRLRRAGAN